MNNRQRQLRRRSNRYAKRRLKVILLTAVTVAAALVLIFLLVGNILNRKVENDQAQDEASRQAATTAPQAPLSSAPSIHGVPVYLVNYDGSALSSLQSQYNSLDPTANALVIPLDQENGTLLYRSGVAASLGARQLLSGGKSLSSMLSGPNERGFYVSASLTLRACAEEDLFTRSAMLSVDASIVCEAIEAGADDVLLFAPAATPDHVSELVAFAEQVHQMLPNAIIGLALSEEILSSPLRDMSIEALAAQFNYLALDTSDAVRESTTDYEQNRINPMLVHLIRYRMRVILPPLEGDAMTAIYNVLQNKSIQNYQLGYQ